MSWTRLVIPLLLLPTAACSSGRIVLPSGGSAPEPVHHGSGRSSPHPMQGPVASLGIPPGHYPPPGQCRIWMPGVAADRQAKCVPCTSIDGEIPLGAWVLYRPSREKGVLRVTTYDRRAASSVVSVDWYDAANGKRVQQPRAADQR